MPEDSEPIDEKVRRFRELATVFKWLERAMEEVDAEMARLAEEIPDDVDLEERPKPSD